MLRVRYLFRGRMHYAEIPDLWPVVLPLKGEFRRRRKRPLRC